VLEVVCRLVRVDFDFKARAFERVPIFYRQPVVPVGPGFLRRPGPARWSGRVIATWLRLCHPELQNGPNFRYLHQ